MDGPGYTIDFAYDGEGRRVKKVSADEATIFVYDASGVLIAEYSGEVAQEPRVSYLTTDHLGSPRVTTNERGVVVNRRDFQPYGEEVFSAERTTALGYTAADSIRQKFTGYERDIESELDFAQARYYNSSHGRFTSVDPLTASATIRNPQTFNRYSYGLNSPYKFTDPLGLLSEYTTGACGNRCLNSDGGSGGGWVGSSYGMGTDWVESVPNPPESQGTDAGVAGDDLSDAAAAGLMCDPNFEFDLQSDETPSTSLTNNAEGGTDITRDVLALSLLGVLSKTFSENGEGAKALKALKLDTKKILDTFYKMKFDADDSKEARTATTTWNKNGGTTVTKHGLVDFLNGSIGWLLHEVVHAAARRDDKDVSSVLSRAKVNITLVTETVPGRNGKSTTKPNYSQSISNFFNSTFRE